MKVLIAPDKFKGSLSAADAASAIVAGVASIDPTAQIVACPMADGGEGTVAALVAATGGRMVSVKVTGPLRDMSVEASYGILGDGTTAIIEMAAASGLELLPDRNRNPLYTTTCGTGELIRHAAAAGVHKIILGIGGSATNDAGIGALQALGCEFRFRRAPIDRPLTALDLPDVLAISPPAGLPEILVACDVENPLYGRKGAAHVYAAQKGATRDERDLLDGHLKQFAERMGKDALAQRPGSGAAGGLGFGLCAFLPNTRMAPGFDLVAEACGFAEKLAGADLCITAEGRFDRSSLHGKTAVGVARRCRSLGIPCIVLAGSVEAEAERPLREETGAIAFAIADGPIKLELAMKQTSQLLTRAAARVMAIFESRK